MCIRDSYFSLNVFALSDEIKDPRFEKQLTPAQQLQLENKKAAVLEKCIGQHKKGRKGHTPQESVAEKFGRVGFVMVLHSTRPLVIVSSFQRAVIVSNRGDFHVHETRKTPFILLYWGIQMCIRDRQITVLVDQGGGSLRPLQFRRPIPNFQIVQRLVQLFGIV